MNHESFIPTKFTHTSHAVHYARVMQELKVKRELTQSQSEREWIDVLHETIRANLWRKSYTNSHTFQPEASHNTNHAPLEPSSSVLIPTALSAFSKINPIQNAHSRNDS